ncbi:D-3-phosphoglycerate dehydrogenase [Propionispira arboris]|uniref:D-3-phosphoglycerate dehydrogenase n=1 Tax=Propionispira arboris TaxID=84035 RepID=A0A1H6XKB7_9FIRM|nr:phosphoglycerate dehydrogenase [Propionispira arboris]SEJ29519.1 D-3-phosphoglycerate dehydrogenase [Propionispira arboris]
MKMKVVIGSRARSRAPEMIKLLEDQGYELVMNPFDRTMTENELIEKIQGASAMVAGSDKVTEKVLKAGMPSLKVVAKQGVGYNSINVEAAKKFGIAVTITPGANSCAVADLTMGLILSSARNIPAMDRAIRRGEWYRHTGCELGGKILGIVGMGHIGGEVAKRAYAFGMKIIAYDVYPQQDFIDKYSVCYVGIDELFKKADFISLHAPAIASTIGMVNADRLKTMKPTAFLINAARGELVVEQDLCDALQNHVIAGAALDVYTQEPPEKSALMDQANITFTAHAGAYTHEAIIGAGIMAGEEIIRVLSGEKPKFNVVK